MSRRVEMHIMRLDSEVHRTNKMPFFPSGRKTWRCAFSNKRTQCYWCNANMAPWRPPELNIYELNYRLEKIEACFAFNRNGCQVITIKLKIQFAWRYMKKLLNVSAFEQQMQDSSIKGKEKWMNVKKNPVSAFQCDYGCVCVILFYLHVFFCFHFSLCFCPGTALLADCVHLFRV